MEVHIMDEKTMNEKTMTAFLRAVKVAAHELGYDVFCAVEGDGVGVGCVSYSNTESKFINYLNKAQINWEESNG